MSEIQPLKTRMRNVVRAILNVLTLFALVLTIGFVAQGIGSLMSPYGSLDAGLIRLILAVPALPVVATLNYLVFGRFAIWNSLQRSAPSAEA